MDLSGPCPIWEGEISAGICYRSQLHAEREKRGFLVGQVTNKQYQADKPRGETVDSALYEQWSPGYNGLFLMDNAVDHIHHIARLRNGRKL